MQNPSSTSSPPVSQARLFQALRWRLLVNSTHVAVSRTPVRLLTIFLSSFIIWLGVFALSLLGFFVLQSQLSLYGNIVGLLFEYLLLALAVLLVFSSGLILYGSLFSSPETNFLLTTPASDDQVFAFKFQGAVSFSSWAFVLLGSPILLAYGIVAWVPWYFYLIVPLFFVGFVLVPGSLGALLCLVVVNIVPRRPRTILIAGAILAGFLLVGWGYGTIRSSWRGTSLPANMERMLEQSSVTQNRLSPSNWMSRGLLAAARGEPGEAVFQLGLVSVNGLFLYLLTAWAAKHLYRRGYNRMATGMMQRKRYGGQWFDRLLSLSTGFLNPQTRLLLVKDIRTFRRDPKQWAQVLIFTGLLSLYFLNIRRLYLEDISWTYQNSISLLNLIATAFLLCAYTGRFIFPMLSLEGNKFWILGLLPLRRERVLWGKFAFSALGGLFIAEFLMVLGDVMLGMPWLVIALHALTVAVLALGLSGLSVGLGACMPNFQENDPSKIAVGFGGTLNLVVGLIFLVLIIALMAGPWHAYASGVEPTERMPDSLRILIGVGLASGIGLGLLAVFLPLMLGAEALRRMEF